jgi:hypothetical protein
MKTAILDTVKEIEEAMDRLRARASLLEDAQRDRKAPEVAVWSAMSMYVTDRLWSRAREGSPPEEVVVAKVSRYTSALIASIALRAKLEGVA